MDDMANALAKDLESALRKLKGGMDDGPFGPNVELTTSESTVLYRILSERLGLSVKTT